MCLRDSLEIPEARIKFLDTGEVENICRVYRNDAHRLIEECMLAANSCAARLLEAKAVPALFRLVRGICSEERGLTSLFVRVNLSRIKAAMQSGLQPC